MNKETCFRHLKRGEKFKDGWGTYIFGGLQCGKASLNTDIYIVTSLSGSKHSGIPNMQVTRVIDDKDNMPTSS